jgi:transcriptional regulator with XRE-family HTH domain
LGELEMPLSPLRRERILREKTLHELGRKTNISPGRLSLIERDLVEPRYREMQAISRALRVSIKRVFPPAKGVSNVN